MIIGEVLGPAGLGGDLRIRPLTDFPERIPRLKTIHVGESLRPYPVVEASVRRNTVILKLAGVDDAAAALELRGALVRIPRELAAPLPEGHYYLHQILGLSVKTTAGEPLGSVVDILRTGGNDVYVLEGPRGEVLIPAIEDVVKEIALDRGEIVIEPLPGLLE
ncbi:MAG: 16S rRNA processing protein RimM [Chloroflexi bacterium]|nr:16S rRNA processing protein RimM [Chloroflexota bacterium]